jgi:hypothetical protein
MKHTVYLLLFLAILSALYAPQRAFAADARCADTFIASPASRSTQSGIMLITGRAQLEGAFVRYQVDFSTSGLNLWVLLNSAPQAVVDGTLARWDTSLVPEGTYDLRVRTIDTSGNYCESVVQGIVVRNRLSVNSNQSPISNPQSLVSIPSLNGTLTVEIPNVPNIPYCTPASSLGSVVTRSVRLCAGQTYRPFTVVGNNLAIIGGGNAAVPYGTLAAAFPTVNAAASVQYGGRAYAITVRGSNVLISGVHVVGATAPQDVGNWLCLYEQCAYGNLPIAGGVNYGGGILLEGSSNTVMNSTITGGVIGIAALNGRGNKLISNSLTALSGWGIFAIAPVQSAFVGNNLQDINRSCTDPGGRFYAGGCESAGMLLMGADTNIVANNVCARSGNCFYLNGEGGRPNNFNKLYGNLCSAPSFNCFEITDAQGIEFDNNRATLTPDNTAGCEIWLVRAQIIVGRNNQVPLCNHRGSHLESHYDPPK